MAIEILAPLEMVLQSNQPLQTDRRCASAAERQTRYAGKMKKGKSIIVALSCILTCLGCGGPVANQSIDQKSLADRKSLLPAEMNITQLSFRNDSGRVQLMLVPQSSGLVVSAGDGNGFINLARQSRGGFQAMCMTGDSNERFFVCGRNLHGLDTEIYSCSIVWNGEVPKLNSELLYHGKEIKDISAIVNLRGWNETVSVWDYGSACMWSIDLVTGQISKMLSSAQMPELLEVRGMMVNTVEADLDLGTPSGVWYTLQAEQEIQLLAFDILWVNAIDYGADGTIDDLFLD